jgi:hypothetical protein
MRPACWRSEAQQALFPIARRQQSGSQIRRRARHHRRVVHPVRCHRPGRDRSLPRQLRLSARRWRSRRGAYVDDDRYGARQAPILNTVVLDNEDGVAGRSDRTIFRRPTSSAANWRRSRPSSRARGHPLRVQVPGMGLLGHQDALGRQNRGGNSHRLLPPRHLGGGRYHARGRSADHGQRHLSRPRGGQRRQRLQRDDASVSGGRAVRSVLGLRLQVRIRRDQQFRRHELLLSLSRVGHIGWQPGPQPVHRRAFGRQRHLWRSVGLLRAGPRGRRPGGHRGLPPHRQRFFRRRNRGGSENGGD